MLANLRISNHTVELIVFQAAVPYRGFIIHEHLGYLSDRVPPKQTDHHLDNYVCCIPTLIWDAFGLESGRYYAKSQQDWFVMDTSWTSKAVTCIPLCLATVRRSCRHYEKGFLPEIFRLLGTFFALVVLFPLSSSSSSSSSESTAFLLRLGSTGKRSSPSCRTARLER